MNYEVIESSFKKADIKTGIFYLPNIMRAIALVLYRHFVL